MLIEPETGVVPTLSRNGRLELFRPATGARFRCCPVGAAVWIALCQHQGRPEAAAEMLAEIWQVDPRRTHGDVCFWAVEFSDAGLVRIEP
jgi:hypothetical protein